MMGQCRGYLVSSQYTILFHLPVHQTAIKREFGVIESVGYVTKLLVWISAQKSMYGL